MDSYPKDYYPRFDNLLQSIASIDSNVNNSIEFNELLLMNGIDSISTNIDINMCDMDGITLLMQASKYGQLQLVKDLIDRGAKIDIKDRYNESTSLMKAILNDNYCIAEYLILKKANVNVRDEELNTCLMYAIQNESLEIVMLLINHGAIINKKNINGYNSLHFASMKDSVCIVKLLLTSHASLVDVTTNSRDTALMIACACGQSEVALVLINEYNADIHAANKYKQTAFLNACHATLLEVCITLVKKGVVIEDCRDHDKSLSAIEVYGSTQFICGVAYRNLISEARKKSDVEMIVNEYRKESNWRRRKQYLPLFFNHSSHDHTLIDKHEINVITVLQMQHIQRSILSYL